MGFLRNALGVFVFALCAIAVAGAQENAEITGVVTDSTGAAVSNATVTITHLATGNVRTTQSGSTGLFAFPGLQVGTYDLKVTATGFKTLTKAGLVLNTAQTLRADAQMDVGTQTQTVTVEANALQIQTETSEVSLADHGRASTSTRHEWPQHDVTGHPGHRCDQYSARL